MDHNLGWLINIFIFGLITILTGCSTPQSGTSIPTAQVVDLYYPPALDYIRSEINSCLKSLNTISPYLHEQSSVYTTLQSGALILRLGEVDWEDSDYFVTQISSQNILFIINAANPINLLDIEELKAIFSGRQTSWKEGSIAGDPISVWVFPEGSELTRWIKDTLLSNTRTSPYSKLAPDPVSILETVSKERSAIGFLPEAWLDDFDPLILNKIKVLNIENGSEELSPLPVLAYLEEKPVGAVKDFLVCLQDK